MLMNMNYGILQYCSSDAAKEQQQVLTSGHVSLFFVFRMYPKYHKVPVYTPLVWKGLDSDPVSWL